MAESPVNVTENPCKMCLPLGVVTAFYGVAGAMSLLHGSQGCSTYIRRHMATHYNEPVDIASSSLSEEGTVFGGEANLLKGLANLIKLYGPKIIGVSTTCLAETIGEDVPAILKKFKAGNPGIETELVPVAAPGYGGSHFEGWWLGLRAIVGHLATDPGRHDGINVIMGPSSPADVRAVKELLEETELEFTVFPDISDNLDGARNPVYSRLPLKGTPVAAIKRMAGARATIELTRFGDPEASPGLFLEKEWGVPLMRLDPPAGLEATDDFLATLGELGGKIKAKTLDRRGRLMDAMADSHKHCALGRAAAFGDPDFVLSTARLCAENGILVKLATTGHKCRDFAKTLKPVMEASGAGVGEGEFVAEDFRDFSFIEKEAERLGVNLLIGSSEARRIEKKLGIPLARATFPIHDRTGGQRTRTFLHDGSLAFLDVLANSLLAEEEAVFRERIVRGVRGAGSRPVGVPATHSKDGPGEKAGGVAIPLFGAAGRSGVAPAIATGKGAHPCFDREAARRDARLHLPVAPSCNVSCNYCSRDGDCPNESRPGVSSAVLSPPEALERFRVAKNKIPNLSVVGFAGPGESLATPELTLETMELIRKEDKDVIFCLSSNGLALPLWLKDLRALGLRHLTVTVNAVERRVAERIYSRVDWMGEVFDGGTGSRILMANQFAGITLAKKLGMAVKANTVYLKGINDRHVPEVHEKLGRLGVDIGNLMPHIPVAGSVFSGLEKPRDVEVRAARLECEVFLPQMSHCRQCRADAAGLLGEGTPDFLRGEGAAGICRGSRTEAPAEASPRRGPVLAPVPAPVFPNASEKAAPGPGEFGMAVASESGVMADTGLGRAERFLARASDGKSLRLPENREVGEPRGGRGRACRSETRTDFRSGGEKRGRDPSVLAEKPGDADAVAAVGIGDSGGRLPGAAGVRAFSSPESADKAVIDAATRLLGERAGSARETGAEREFPATARNAR
ncbi:MAG: radical SAM protein [Deltaproteobacteria bacterium]|jgi:nitrogenase cofactor biosynthesis protein NifB|nr:radical SAM protein [Deltaproteobacteria bacterium]